MICTVNGTVSGRQGSLLAVMTCTIQENDERYLRMYLTKIPYDQNLVRNDNETWPLHSLELFYCHDPILNNRCVVTHAFVESQAKL